MEFYLKQVVKKNINYSIQRTESIPIKKVGKFKLFDLKITLL